MPSQDLVFWACSDKTLGDFLEQWPSLHTPTCAYYGHHSHCASTCTIRNVCVFQGMSTAISPALLIEKYPYFQGFAGRMKAGHTINNEYNLLFFPRLPQKRPLGKFCTDWKSLAFAGGLEQVYCSEWGHSSSPLRVWWDHLQHGQFLWQARWGGLGQAGFVGRGYRIPPGAASRSSCWKNTQRDLEIAVPQSKCQCQSVP